MNNTILARFETNKRKASTVPNNLKPIPLSPAAKKAINAQLSAQTNAARTAAKTAYNALPAAERRNANQFMNSLTIANKLNLFNRYKANAKAKAKPKPKTKTKTKTKGFFSRMFG